MLRWEEPPKAKTGPRAAAYGAEAAALRENPGRWALIAEGVSATVAHRIRTGQQAGFRPAGAFDATTRKNPAGKHDIFARFVGGDQ